MAVGVLIITHGEIGDQFVKTAESTLAGKIPLPCHTISVSQTCDPDALVKKCRTVIEQINTGSGVLVLTDIYGSTPSNIANRLATDSNIKVIAGINLPMLIRILNYPDSDLDELAEKALSGGHDGIIYCEQINKPVCGTK